MIGCLNCTTSILCTVCDSTNNFMFNGGNCSCVSNSYTLNGLTCSLCSSLLLGCVTCDTTTNCQSCDLTNHFTLTGSIPNKCKCDIYYALNNSICTLCSTLITNCVQCSDNVTCTVCSSPFYGLVGSSCQLCNTIAVLGNCS
jgi:hypothetical protein